MPVSTKLQVRRDTAANWTSTNPTLASGEIGFETDTLKFKIGNGSTAWNSLAYQNASTSAQNYAQTLGTKTLVTSGATVPYTIVSVTITTSGSPVLVMASGDAENLTASTWCRLQLFRGTTAIGNDIQAEGTGASENSPYALQVVDAQAAGTYTYHLKVTNIAGGNFNFGENTGPVITAIELNSLAGSANLATNIANGAAGQLPYQNAANSTTFVAIGTTNNQTLAYNTATNTPYWTTAPNIGAATGTSLNVTGQLISTQATGTAPFTVTSTTRVANLNVATSGTTSNVLGGATGGVLYQSAANTTAFLTAPATNNSVLTYNTATGAPEWDSPPLTMSVLMGYTSTATAAGFTSLSNTSSYYQQFTGTTTQTVVMPNTATLLTGWTFHIVNNSTGNVTANTFANAATLMVIPANTTAMVTCINTASNTATGWEIGLTDFGTYTGTGSVVMNTSPTISSPAITTGITTTSTTFGLVNANATTVNFADAATTLSIGNTATAGQTVNMFTAATGNSTYNFATGAVGTSTTKTINIGTGAGTAGTTNINIGGNPAVSTSNITLNGKSTITPANAVAATSAETAGYIGMPQSLQTGAYTLVAGDAGKHIYYTASGQTVTIPNNTAVAFQIGTTVTFITAPSVSLSIAINTDTLRLANTSTTGTRTLAANGVATAIKVTSTAWIISGNGLS